jgi:16S rRNA (cytosine967-C5)-methyltransferase
LLKRANHTIPELAGFQNGSFQVQDEAAQLVTFLLNPTPGEKILDACAGLGGKTGHIAQLMNNTGSITAADHHPEKLKSLAREMGRLGITIVSPCKVNLNKRSAVSTLDHFDRVFIDAPCSGLGVLRRHPDAKWRHSAKTILKMADRQFEMLRHLGGRVKPGGIMVYSVCSTEPEENEAVISRFLHHHPDFSVSPAAPFLPDTARHLAGSDGFFRSSIHHHQMDGFFAARLLKKSES